MNSFVFKMDNCDEILREWGPLTDLLSKVPAKAQSGIFTKDIFLTCVDILPDFIALGTNIGIVYWFNRKNNDLQRLRCEYPNSKITYVKIISTVDYMVACGSDNGQVTIFQIPKSHPESLPNILKPKTNKQVERYTVADLHHSPVSCLEWSKNGMKLFSGDKNGLVVLTELDFYMHICKSVEMLNESYEVVQLSYCQQYLLISTVYRSIICQKQDKWNVCQVGKKDRKSLGKLGGAFCKVGLKPSDLVAYCCRPGLRIWVSDVNGNVQQTLLFKDLIGKDCYEVPLLNPISIGVKKLRPQRELSFGMLFMFAEKYLVTHDSDVVYVLDPSNLRVVAMISHLRRVLSVAVCKDEIFVLEGERSLIRIAFHPSDSLVSDTMQTSIPTASTFLPIANSIKDIATKLQSTSIISALPTFLDQTTSITECAIQTDITSVVNAEEALELPSMQDTPLDSESVPYIHSVDASNRVLYASQRNGACDYSCAVSSGNNNTPKHNSHQNKFLTNPQNLGILLGSFIDRNEYSSKFESPKHIPQSNRNIQDVEKQMESLKKLELYEKIGEQGFEKDILFKHTRKKRTYRRNNADNVSVTSSDSDCKTTDSGDIVTKPCLLNLSAVGAQNSFSIQPDLRSPDSIQNDIKMKEKLLSDFLNFDKIKPTSSTKLASEKASVNNYGSLLRNGFSDEAQNAKLRKNLPNSTKNVDETKVMRESLRINSERDRDKLSGENGTVSGESIDLKNRSASASRLNRSVPILTGKCRINSSNNIPVCQIPNAWKVGELSLSPDNETSDISLTDWEII